MARVVIASVSEEYRMRLSRLLSSAGFTVFRCCVSGGDVRRALNACGDGLAILMGELPDLAPDELAWDYAPGVKVLLIARPQTLARYETAALWKLALPVPGRTVIEMAEAMRLAHDADLPRRGEKENAAIDRAKAVLMNRYGITEGEAHRRLQRYAMNHGMKMEACAAKVLREAEGASE